MIKSKMKFNLLKLYVITPYFHKCSRNYKYFQCFYKFSLTKNNFYILQQYHYHQPILWLVNTNVTDRRDTNIDWPEQEPVLNKPPQSWFQTQLVQQRTPHTHSWQTKQLTQLQIDYVPPKNTNKTISSFCTIFAASVLRRQVDQIKQMLPYRYNIFTQWRNRMNQS